MINKDFAVDSACTAFEQCTDMLKLVVEDIDDAMKGARKSDQHAGYYARGRMGTHLNCLSMLLGLLLDVQRGIEGVAE